MKTLQIFFLVAASLFPAANGARHAVPMKSYQVDLNDPPETRWNHVMEPYLPSIPLVLDYFNTLVSLDGLGASYNYRSHYPTDP